MSDLILVQQGSTYTPATSRTASTAPGAKVFFGHPDPSGLSAHLRSGDHWFPVEGAAPPGPPDPPPVTVESFRDFTVRNAGLSRVSGSLLDAVIYEMERRSSSKAKQVAALTSKDTNPYRLIRLGGTDLSQVPTDIDFGNCTVQGTDQGHIYHGVILGYSDGAHIHDLIVNGIPGLSSSPPKETMSLELWHPNDALIEDTLLDGRDEAGVPTAASLLAYNFNTGTTTVNNLTAVYAKYGFGCAWWRCRGTQIMNDSAVGVGCRKGVNIEQSDGGSYVFNRVDFSGIQNVPYVAQISRRVGTTHTVPVEFHDCISPSSDGVLRVRTYPTLDGWDSDDDALIRCYVGGVDVTDDPTQFKIVHSDAAAVARARAAAPAREAARPEEFQEVG